MKVLFCSPYSDVAGVVKGGINTWGRYVMAYYSQYANDDVELLPISLDRYTYVADGQSVVSRIASGYKEYMRAIKSGRSQDG